MKKIIVVLLLLIPLIVLFTITASGKIISAEVSIGIEHFELRHMGERVTEVTINFGEYQKKKMKYQLIPVYYPGVADVSGFKWYSDDESVATVDKKGIVTFLDCGFVKITAQSLDNASVRASCSFFVEDDAIHELQLYSYETGEEVSRISLSMFEQSVYRVEVTPYSALVSDIAYASSDESVFEVNDNGVLLGKSEGSATLRVFATDKTGKVIEKPLPVTVEGTALVKRRQVYSFETELDLTPYLAAGHAEGGNLVSLTGVGEGESRTFKVTDGSRTDRITVTRLGYQKTLGLAETDLFLGTVWEEGVFLAKDRSMTITPVDLATMQPLSGVTVTSDDPEVLAVDTTRILARKAGKAILRLEKQGYQLFEFEITVAIPIEYFSLNFHADNDAVGLGSERVYGTRSFYDGVIEEGIRVVPEQVYPANSGNNQFSYSVKEPYASVDRTGRVTFKEDAVGKSVTVTVKSTFSANGISRSYTFKNVVKGINVGLGYGANTCDPNNGIMPSFTPYYEAVKTMYEDRDQALVFQTNVYVPSKEEVEAIDGQYKKLCFIRDIYGNGYKIDGQFFQYDFESRFFEQGEDSQLEEDQKKITISDLFVNSYAPLGSDSKETFTLLMEKGGVPIRTYYSERPDFEIDFRYCVFQYSYTHAIVIGGTVVFDGCIFRNSAGVSLMVESLYQKESYATVNNCIFSNSISMAGLVSNGSFPLPKTEVVHYNALRWTGRNYIYNWKKIDEIRLDIIPHGVTGNDAANAMLDAVNDKLTECARISMRQEENAAFVYKHTDRNSYVNMGVLLINFWGEPKMIVNAEREKITDGMQVIYDQNASLTEIKLETTPLGALESLASKFLRFDNPNYMINDKTSSGEYLTKPDENYKLDEKTFARLRGVGD